MRSVEEVNEARRSVLPSNPVPISKGALLEKGRTFLVAYQARGSEIIGWVAYHRRGHAITRASTPHLHALNPSHCSLPAVLSPFVSIHRRHHESFQQITDPASFGLGFVLTSIWGRTVELVARPVQSRRQSRVPARSKLQGISKRAGLRVRS